MRFMQVKIVEERKRNAKVNGKVIPNLHSGLYFG